MFGFQLTLWLCQDFHPLLSLGAEAGLARCQLPGKGNIPGKGVFIAGARQESKNLLHIWKRQKYLFIFKIWYWIIWTNFFYFSHMQTFLASWCNLLFSLLTGTLCLLTNAMFPLSFLSISFGTFSAKGEAPIPFLRVFSALLPSPVIRHQRPKCSSVYIWAGFTSSDFHYCQTSAGAHIMQTRLVQVPSQVEWSSISQWWKFKFLHSEVPSQKELGPKNWNSYTTLM